MPSRNRVEQKLRRLARRLPFHVAGTLSVPPIHHYPAVRLAHPVGQLCAVFLLQRTERPVGIRNHVDATTRSNQNGVVGGRYTSRSTLFRCFENLSRIFDELAHEALSFRLQQIRAASKFFQVSYIFTL